MKQCGSLPLGLDLGSSRIRMAAACRNRDGTTILAAVAVRDLPEGLVTPGAIGEPALVAAIVEDLRHELNVRERRCVVSISPHVAAVRCIRFPTMNASERARAARFEAQRFAPTRAHNEDCVVRMHPVQGQEGVHAVGAVSAGVLDAVTACVRLSGLRPIAADFDAFAFARAFPRYDAVVDVGYNAVRLHAFAVSGPVSIAIEGGGCQITDAIAADLSIERPAAEKRKRQIGTAGAGESARAAQSRAVAASVAKARERIAVARIAMVGNGARLLGLPSAIAEAAGVSVETVPSEILGGDAYPPDVVNAASADWTLAAALAMWSVQ